MLKQVPYLQEEVPNEVFPKYIWPQCPRGSKVAWNILRKILYFHFHNINYLKRGMIANRCANI